MIAWLGGAAFAGSLGYLIYFYVVTLGSPAGEAARLSRHLAWNVALFALFAAHHSLFARSRAKQSLATVFPPGMERSLYVWVASALLVGVCVLWAPIAGIVYQATGWWRVPLWLLQGIGLWLAVRGARVIDPLSLAGIRQARRQSSGEALRIVGPFRLVRHPIYLGWMLLVFATPAMTANRLVFAVVSSTYLILAIPWEERSLVAAHGDQYREYQLAVRWRVLPGIW